MEEFVEAWPEPVLLVDEELVVVAASAEFRRLLGVSHELAGTSLSEWIALPPSVGGFREAEGPQRKASACAAFLKLDCIQLGASCRVRWVPQTLLLELRASCGDLRQRGYVQPWAEGRALLRFRDPIAGDNDLVETLLHVAPYGALLVSDLGRIEMVNAHLCEIFGYEADEMIGKPLEMLVPYRVRASHALERDRFRAEAAPRTMGVGRELTGLHKDGAELPIEVGLSRIACREQLFTLAAVADRTKTATLIKDLRDTNLELAEFTRVASHDLRSPLRAIADLVDWIDEEVREHLPTLPGELAHNLDRLGQRVLHLEGVLSDLMRYTRLGTESEPPADFSIAEALDEVEAELALPERFVVDRRLATTRLVAVRSAFTSVLKTLIGNAVVHHDRDAGCIVISSECVGAECIVRVCDDGPGVEACCHERIFGLFQTAKAPSPASGSGMGLAVARRLVERSGGRLEVSSNRHQSGLTFSVYWPRVRRRDVHGAHASNPSR